MTTVAYKMGKDQPAIYALEGSVAVGGAALRWLQNRLGMLKSTDESELVCDLMHLLEFGKLMATITIFPVGLKCLFNG